MVVRADVPPRVVLAAGPIIGAFNLRDRFHEEAERGLRRLADGHARMLTPAPVVFDVFKWLAYNVGAAAARLALDGMLGSFEIIEVNRAIIDELAIMVNATSRWPGSLEDAVLAYVGTSMNAPVWTFNYRDLRAFRNLQFWSPG